MNRLLSGSVHHNKMKIDKKIGQDSNSKPIITQ